MTHTIWAAWYVQSNVHPAAAIMLLLLSELATMIHGCCVTQHALKIMRSLTLLLTVYV